MQNSTLDKKPTNALLSHHPMNKPNHLPAVVPASGGALTTTPGTQRIATRMADDLLAVAHSRERALAAQRHYRIGKYDFREPDHAQIQRWARMLGMGPEAVVEWLDGCKQKCEDGDEIELTSFHVQNGSIVSLAWDFSKFPLTDWAWIDGLKIEKLGIIGSPPDNHLPPLPRSLIALFCMGCGLSRLDLVGVPMLEKLRCGYNKLTHLDLSPVPSLDELWCFDNKLSELELTYTPGLVWLECGANELTQLNLACVEDLVFLECGANGLTSLDITPLLALDVLWCAQNMLTELDLSNSDLRGLDCGCNQLTHLDLTPVPGLTKLDCSCNYLTDLDLTPVSGLTDLSCWSNQLTNLDMTHVPGLTTLWCDKKVRLTNAPRNLKVGRI